MTPLNVKFAVAAAVVAVAVFAGGTGGWMVNGWRLGARIADLEGKVSAFEGANKRCSEAVSDIKGAVKALAEQGDKRAKAAEDAVKRAEQGAQRFLKSARAALERPMPKAGEECATAAREAREYVERRKRSP